MKRKNTPQVLAGDLITPNCPVCNHDHAEGTTCHKCSHFRKMTKDPNAIIGVDYAAGAAGAGAGGPADAAICTPVTGAYAANSATRQNTTSSGSTVGYGGSSAVPVGWTPAAGAAGAGAGAGAGVTPEQVAAQHAAAQAAAQQAAAAQQQHLLAMQAAHAQQALPMAPEAQVMAQQQQQQQQQLLMQTAMHNGLDQQAAQVWASQQMNAMAQAQHSAHSQAVAAQQALAQQVEAQQASFTFGPPKIGQ